MKILKTRTFLFLAILLIFALAFSGCSTEKTVETGKGEVTVETDDETVEITSEDETVNIEVTNKDETVSVEISNKDEAVNVEIKPEGGAQIPEGYPEDIFPIYPGSIIIMGQTMSDNGISNYSVSLKHGDDIEKVYSFYKGHTEKGQNLMDLKTQNTHSLAGSIDGYDFGIIIAPNNLGGDETTMIQISLTKQK